MAKIVKENGYLNYSIEDDEVVIDLVEVYTKRTGTGSELVRELINWARENDYSSIGLCAYPQDDSITLESLVKFYDKLGFDVDYDDGNEVLMSYSL